MPQFIIYGVLGVLIGARLGHVLFYDLEKAINTRVDLRDSGRVGLRPWSVLWLILAMYLHEVARCALLEGRAILRFGGPGAPLVAIGKLFNSEIGDGATTRRASLSRVDKSSDAPLRYRRSLRGRDSASSF